jgi:DNA mismatch repair protein MutL
MSKIAILPPLIAERIAAGEVIERPASVVKELVENSIDAGATQVEVRLQKGGCDLIEVLDDGHGMAKDDLEISVCRHATSKIKLFEDLSKLNTLGFRGEALPSIAAVAELTITSRNVEETETYEIKAAHTAPVQAKSERVANYNFLGKSHGTRIRVASLFSQIPARLKFMKSPGAESSAVREILERLALTHPEVRFALFSEERKLLDLPIESLAKRTERMLGDGNPFEVAQVKLDGAWAIEIIWLRGLSNPHTRSMYQIVNGRALRDRTLQMAMLQPLRQSFLPGNFPAMVVKLDIPTDEIDVNVHPTKTEIRFLDSRKIFALCHAAIDRLLVESTPTENLGNFWKERAEESANQNFSSHHYIPNRQGYLTPTSVGVATNTSGEENPALMGSPPSLNDDFSFDTTPFGQFRGVLFSTYFVFEQGDELLLIDQHAAHERIRYERLKNSVLKREVIEQQELLVPEVIKLTTDKIHELKAKIALLPILGFDAEIFSEESVLFRTIPAVWGMSGLTPRLKNLLERLIDSEVDVENKTLTWDETLFEKVAMEACRSSFKAGDHIHEAGAVDLTRKLMKCEHPGNCPHGRPTFIKINKLKVEEWFSRKI